VASSTLLPNFLTGCGESPPPAPPIASAPIVSNVPPSYLQDPVDVLRVIDGDTIEIRKGELVTKVRIKGINTPELHPDPEGSPPEAYAQAAQTFTFRHIGPQVDLEFNSDCDGETAWDTCRDSYNRLLAYIRSADGKDFGTKLLARGLARVYRWPQDNIPNFDRKDTYLALEEEAQSNELGIWGD